MDEKMDEHAFDHSESMLLDRNDSIFKKIEMNVAPVSTQGDEEYEFDLDFDEKEYQESMIND